MATTETIANYKVTIGIECHVQLKTATKLFSGADNDARDKAPNTTVSPICFGLPGTLPVLNREAIRLAIRAGHTLGSDIAPLSRFERKHYFYPDLPKGYQITQLTEPIIGAGTIEVPLGEGSFTVRIHHAHLEEDAGKLTHPTGADYSLVDLNRAGTPLIEIVSEPDIHSPQEARAYAQELYLLMTYAAVTDGDLYHGNMRFDVNLSVAPADATALGTRAEIKNLNSFRSVEKAAEYEVHRQIELLESGGTVVQETRGWDEATQKTNSQRSKEEAHDYRYFPDADIPPVRLTREEIDAERQHMPILPSEYRRQFTQLNIDSSVMNALLASQNSAKLIASILKNTGVTEARHVAHWFASAVKGGLSEEESVQANDVTIDDENFVELSRMVSQQEVSSSAAKSIFHEMLRTSQPPREIAAAKNLLQTSDESEIEAIVDAVLADPASEKAVADIKAGNDRAIGFLVGQAMKQSHGKANPALLQQIIRRKL